MKTLCKNHSIFAIFSQALYFVAAVCLLQGCHKAVTIMLPDRQYKLATLCKEWDSSSTAAPNEIQWRGIEQRYELARNEMVRGWGDKIEGFIGRITKIEHHYFQLSDPVERWGEGPWDIEIEAQTTNLGNSSFQASLFETEPAFSQVANISINQFVVFSGRFERNEEGELKGDCFNFHIKLEAIKLYTERH